jgi:hypothetical protein
MNSDNTGRGDVTDERERRLSSTRGQRAADSQLGAWLDTGYTR